jgi:hypothetical protein
MPCHVRLGSNFVHPFLQSCPYRRTGPGAKQTTRLFVKIYIRQPEKLAGNILCYW